MIIYYVYFLFSLKDYKTYVGFTINLKERIKKHNNGLVKSTKNRRPLKIIYFEKHENKLKAVKKEKYYKTAAGRRKMKKILKNKILRKNNKIKIIIPKI